MNRSIAAFALLLALALVAQVSSVASAQRGRAKDAAAQEDGDEQTGRKGRKKGKGKKRGVAPTEEQLEETAEERAEYFETCDHDGNGWISFAEAEESLGLDRGAYAVYDRDRDGRIRRDEFDERYFVMLQRTGAFPPPAEGRRRAAGPRSPVQLRAAYDANGDSGIDGAELGQLFVEYGRDELDGEVVLRKLDRDRSDRIDGEELDQLVRLLATPRELSRDPDEDEAPPATIQELFGARLPRGDEPDLVPQPPRIRGPVPHFTRLDLDGDGQISLQDLQRLQAPLVLKARASAVLASLDADEDGTVSEAEFVGSMSASQ